MAAYTLLLNATKLYGDIFVNFILVNFAGDIPVSRTVNPFFAKPVDFESLL